MLDTTMHKPNTMCNVYINLTQPMFGSCFTSCLLEGACLIYVNCVCVCVCRIVVSNIHCVVFLLFLFRLVYPKLSASLDCHFWIALWYSLTFSYRRLTFSQIVFGPPRFQPNIIILPVFFFFFFH